LHPNQISQWKREFMENAEKAFDGDTTTTVVILPEFQTIGLVEIYELYTNEYETIKKKIYSNLQS
jgi:hypothetical protein